MRIWEYTTTKVTLATFLATLVLIGGFATWNKLDSELWTRDDTLTGGFLGLFLILAILIVVMWYAILGAIIRICDHGKAESAEWADYDSWHN